MAQYRIELEVSVVVVVVVRVPVVQALVSVLLLPQGSGVRSGATLRMAKARMPEAEGVSGHSGFRAELRLLHTYSITT